MQQYYTISCALNECMIAIAKNVWTNKITLSKGGGIQSRSNRIQPIKRPHDHVHVKNAFTPFLLLPTPWKRAHLHGEHSRQKPRPPLIEVVTVYSLQYNVFWRWLTTGQARIAIRPFGLFVSIWEVMGWSLGVTLLLTVGLSYRKVPGQRLPVSWTQCMCSL